MTGAFDLRHWQGVTVSARPAVIQKTGGYQAALAIGQPDESSDEGFLNGAEIMSDVDKLFETEDEAMQEAEQMLSRFALAHGIGASRYAQ